MGLFDVFKKDAEKKEEKIAENKKEINESVKEGAEDTEEINIDEFLKQQRYTELLQRIYKDADHGISMMKQSTVNENIFVLGYIENVVMPELKKENKESDFYWFQNTMLLYRKIFYDKVMKMDKLWKIVSKTTGFPFMDRGCEHLLICEENNETVIENLKKMYYDVDIVELKNEDLKDELNELFRLGYKGLGFSDGLHRPYYMSKESIVGIENIPVEKFYINPYTQYSMISFFQEMRRNVKYEGADKIRQNLENTMIDSIINAVFLIPIKKDNANQAQLPVYIAAEDKEKGIVIPGLYVFTDKTEMNVIGKDDNSWDTSTYTFPQLMKLKDEAHIHEICINCGSMNFKLNEQSLEVLKNIYDTRKEEIQAKREQWETVDLPNMIKDKNVPMIKDLKGAPIFARKEDGVLMSKFVFDILAERGLKEEIMQTFFDDSSINTVYLFDFDFRRIALNVRDTESKKGLFVMPMRYDDENDEDPVNDNVLHYTQDAQKISEADGTDKNINTEEREMHFYTIKNKDTEKVYVPIFSDEREAEKIYSRRKYRYCMASYKDVIDNMSEYDGIVINPASMSFIVEKNLLDNIFDIENK